MRALVAGLASVQDMEPDPAVVPDLARALDLDRAADLDSVQDMGLSQAEELSVQEPTPGIQYQPPLKLSGERCLVELGAVAGVAAAVELVRFPEWWRALPAVRGDQERESAGLSRAKRKFTKFSAR